MKVKGKTQELPVSGPDTVRQLLLLATVDVEGVVVVVVVELVVVVVGVVVVVVVKEDEQLSVVQT